MEENIFENEIPAEQIQTVQDEPMETETELYVYKVNGRWILDVFSLVGF